MAAWKEEVFCCSSLYERGKKANRKENVHVFIVYIYAVFIVIYTQGGLESIYLYIHRRRIFMKCLNFEFFFAPHECVFL